MPAGLSGSFRTSARVRGVIARGLGLRLPLRAALGDVYQALLLSL